MEIMKKRPKVMLVDDNIANLATGKNMLKDHYEVYALPSAAKLFEFLEETTPDLILLDIEMPVMNGYDAIKILKRDRRYADIPVIFLTAVSGEENELEGLELGAVDYITKPFSASLLLKRVENYLHIKQQKDDLTKFNESLLKLVNEKMSDVFELQNTIIATMADLVECRDSATGGHIARTRKYVQIFVDKLISERVYTNQTHKWNTEYFLSSVPLHDVGKIAVSDAILNKPGSLTAAEFKTMKTHAAVGAKIIQRMEENANVTDFLKYAEIIAGTHHEKWDGSGYPLGLRGTDIPLEGRIMAIADVYDALISVRPYKAALPAEKAAQVIIGDSGAHFDPLLVDVFRMLQNEFAAIAVAYNETLNESFRKSA